jgi:SAM-dependent MidA family methyltransferase
MPQLPTPEPDALTASQSLADRIKHEIHAANGWISFARYMELALYEPGLGYYSGGSAKLGSSGDFITAPEISCLFGKTLARQLAQILSMGGSQVVEFGAGTGKLAIDLLSELESLNALPDQYQIVELSGDLRSRQQAAIQKHLPHLASRIQWLDQLPGSISGAIIGNEVLDAMPVHLVATESNIIYERGVTVHENAFAWKDQPAAGPLLEHTHSLRLPDGYVTEINLAAPAFIATLAGKLQQGVMIFVDYGFGQSEYYHPQRNRGTLMCHYRHHAHDDPFYLPGLQDITAHVDFTQIAGTGIDHGLQLLGYTTQASFLINCGITGILGEVPSENVAEYLPLANQAQRLLSPAEMGELFKVIALGKGIQEPLIGFTSGDRSRQL